jgi:predicted Zn-dependent peptidase
MNYKEHKLKNGLNVLVVPMPGSVSATVTVWVKTGSRNEEERLNGISHFLEHMVFKGSKKRPSAKAISEAVDGFGGEFNASTSKEITEFYIKSRVGKLRDAIDVLSDMVLNPLIDQKEIDKERNVIFSEMAMYEDMPGRKVGEIFENVIFDGNSLGWDIIGTKESLKNINRQEFLDYRNNVYNPENMLVTVAGGVEVTDVTKMVEEYFGEMKGSEKEKLQMSKFESHQTQLQTKIVSKKTDQGHFVLGFLGDPMGHKDRYAESVLRTILGGGMSSRMFLEVRERLGLAYSVQVMSDHAIDTGYMAVYAGVDPEKGEQAAKVILEECYKMTDSATANISKEEWNKAKEYMKGHLALALEDSGDVNDFFGLEKLLLGNVRTPEEIMKKIDEVTEEEVIAVAKRFFKREKLNLAVIGPYDTFSI